MCEVGFYKKLKINVFMSGRIVDRFLGLAVSIPSALGVRLQVSGLQYCGLKLDTGLVRLPYSHGKRDEGRWQLLIRYRSGSSRSWKPWLGLLFQPENKMSHHQRLQSALLFYTPSTLLCVRHVWPMGLKLCVPGWWWTENAICLRRLCSIFLSLNK